MEFDSRWSFIGWNEISDVSWGVEGRMPPLQVFDFPVVLAKIMPNARLAPPSLGLAPGKS